MITLRAAQLEDAAAMAVVDAASWPSGMATDADGYRSRVLAYPDGQLLAISNGEIVGVSTSQRISAEYLQRTSDSYSELTDNDRFTASHQNDGEIYQLIGVSVLPKFRGFNLGRQLVDEQINRARNIRGVERIIGFTRPAGHREHAEIPMSTYISMCRPSGMHVDPVLAFHLEAGARIVSIHPGFRPEDSESSCYGVLIEYALI